MSDGNLRRRPVDSPTLVPAGARSDVRRLGWTRCHEDLGSEAVRFESFEMSAQVGTRPFKWSLLRIEWRFEPCHSDIRHTPPRSRPARFRIIFLDQLSICQLTQISQDSNLNLGAAPPQFQINPSGVPLTSAIADNFQCESGWDDIHMQSPHAGVIEIIRRPYSR